MNLDSDDSGHDEPKIRKLEETKITNPAKEKLPEEFAETTTTSEGQIVEKQSEFTKPENKDQPDAKKPTPPSKKDLIVRKLKYQLK